jgi:hypothetical protein
MGWVKRMRPSPALAVSIIALVVAMAGTTYAITVPKKSVGPKQLKPTVLRFTDVTVPDGHPSVPTGAVTGHTSCGRRERLFGGGARLIPDNVDDVPITASHPGSEPIGPETLGAPGTVPSEQLWTASAHNPFGGSGAVTMRVYALCLK